MKTKIGSLRKIFWIAGGFFLVVVLVASAGSSNSPSAVATSSPTSVTATTSSDTQVGNSVPISIQKPSSVVSSTVVQNPSPTQTHFGIRTKTSGCVANQTLPDPACSPGAVLTTDTSVICVVGYTSTVRNVSDSEKRQVFAEYGIDYSIHSGYEVDHIISLELGGSNDISNLYPESYTIQYNAHVKDTFENYLHSQICSNKMPVAVAQTEIATDWLKYYLAWKNGTDVPPPAAQVTATPAPVTTTQTSSTSGAAYYTSSYGSSKYYYPAACSGWQSLSTKYLVSFPTLSELIAKYPDRTLAPGC